MTLRAHVVLGPKDKEGVVNTDLLVYGTTNLRVCDASIFPDMVAGHPVRYRFIL